LKTHRPTWIIMVCFAAFLSCWAGIARAQEPSKTSPEMKCCREAYNAKNWKDAAKWCQIAAEQGVAKAQFYLGIMYYTGRGVPKDYAEAAKWYRKAAEQGHAKAQFYLSFMYKIGDGVPQDNAEAAKWYRKAAEQGVAEAQFSLGLKYNIGDGVPQDYAEAVKWFRKAAEQGHADAQNNLGVMYANGRGVPKDYAEAVKWYRKAAEQGHADAQYNLGVMYAYGLGVPQDYAKAVKWYRKAAEQGVAEAQFSLGLRYNIGDGVPQDYAEAVKWYRKAAEQGHAKAQYYLGVMYYTGQGVPQDYAEAVKWFRKAAEKEIALAQYNLGLMYALGKGVMESGAAAADWFYKAGIAYLKEKQKEKALSCVERIQDLKSKLHLNVPNYFLAQQLMQKIYEGSSTATTSPEKQPEISMGTAWPVAAGFAVTAFHVVRGHSTLLLLTKNGKKLNASVLMYDTANDIALLEVASPDKLPIAIPLATKQARVGDKVFTIGYPHPDLMGAEPKLTDGIISSLTGIGNDPRTYQISVPVQAGNSGGPLLNMNGEAIGIVISKLNAAEMFKRTNDITENANYAVKIFYLNALLMALPNKHSIAVQPRLEGEGFSLDWHFVEIRRF